MPLLAATQRRHTDIVDLLLQRDDVDVNLEDTEVEILTALCSFSCSKLLLVAVCVRTTFDHLFSAALVDECSQRANGTTLLVDPVANHIDMSEINGVNALLWDVSELAYQKFTEFV